MWFKRSNGFIYNITHDAHIKRFKEEGAVEIPEPVAPTPQEGAPDSSATVPLVDDEQSSKSSKGKKG